MDLAVIALSARPLAASASRAGLAALALDLFADLDTCAHAARCVRVHKKGGLAFDGDDLLQALASLSPPGLPVVLGGGFEHDTGLMQRIGERNPILGNMAETVRLLKDPLALSALCGHLRVPFPAVTLEAPAGALQETALVEKQIGGLGGSHVRARAAGDVSPPAPGRYLQARVEGDTYSLVLLCNGTDSRVVGAVRQWTAPSPDQPFRYGGALGPVALPGGHGGAILRGAQTIAQVCGLVGIVSFDVVIGPSGWWLLEINPRPGSSLEILDVDPLPPLLALHLAACGGKLPKALPTPRGVSATAVLYADADVMIPPGDWPADVGDRLAAGSVIPRGAPICTVKAQAATPEATRVAVEARLAEMRGRLGLPSPDA
ncbi:ATP-grasp domain-containing protein [Aquabacter cavernae]|uniref:ATP-grasp domain-containing protein n=1 Tax=Aquabacter cavernae TaxID=2496029 RepID=UPI000F8D1E14|nr:ATP-grasp domain-containing protein [Aquabacter cavernae]